jgi:hypothetical protein
MARPLSSNEGMKKTELQSKLRDIHALITKSMFAQKEPDRNESDEFLIEAEDELEDLESRIALEVD